MLILNTFNKHIFDATLEFLWVHDSFNSYTPTLLGYNDSTIWVSKPHSLGSQPFQNSQIYTHTHTIITYNKNVIIEYSEFLKLYEWF